jgi:hypothetical protein
MSKWLVYGAAIVSLLLVGGCIIVSGIVESTLRTERSHNSMKFCITGIALALLMYLGGCIIVTGNDFDESNKCGIAGSPQGWRRF